MVSKDKIRRILDSYDKKNITIATGCSHTSLQIFHGAKLEGFRTLGISVQQKTKMYDAFPAAKPDDFLYVDSYAQLIDMTDYLIEQNVIVVPHGSFVEYMTPAIFESWEVPSFGNRMVLDWEADREKEREWLTSAGVKMPRIISDAQKIDRPVLVKYHGAKGGRGFFIAKDYPEFKMGLEHAKKYHIQEYVLGTRYYVHFFYSPIKTEGYKLSKGVLELLSMDRRDESNIDEMYKLGSVEELKRHGFFPTFVVTGNVPIVARESLLPKFFDLGERIIESSFNLFGGLIGPFCIESIVTDQLDVVVFEVSARIVAGTNPYISGSSYSDLIQPGLSTGRRIAQEIKLGVEKGLLHEIIT
ncbi:MAG: formate--phosphoribosylaminoimidazolecarboxamide ligase [Thermoplasmata archaeon]|nr:formate--phosphoribosylaminoimidazolecarboxamide ligase [Thermoplasmata archaeon]